MSATARQRLAVARGAFLAIAGRNVKLPLDTLQKEDESLAQPGANPHGGPGGPMGGGALPPGHP